MSAEDNKAIIRRLIEEVYNEGNLDVVDELVAPDVFDHAAVSEYQHGIASFKHFRAQSGISPHWQKFLY